MRHERICMYLYSIRTGGEYSFELLLSNSLASDKAFIIVNNTIILMISLRRKIFALFAKQLNAIKLRLFLYK